ncbi:MAG: FAD-dependent oxidoreductase, partial [Lachnospiraceae bacterium]|nr:FAD-dependent oxidoreductase [Lachnospiraceae bacterium]
MIRITQVKLPITHTYEDLLIRTAKLLRISDSQIKNLRIVKQSVDARKREEVSYSYVLDVETDREEQVVKRCKNPNASISKEKPYRFPEHGEEVLSHPPVIVGSGPAGLFCGLMLARHGYKPILLERGGSVEERTKAVQEFWKTGKLDKNCNVQFGEGGAGTFSDGKLNTLVKDPIGRNRLVLQLFTEFGADPSICYLNKPHIGTDVLSGIVAAMREEIIRLGGEV